MNEFWFLKCARHISQGIRPSRHNAIYKQLKYATSYTYRAYYDVLIIYWYPDTYIGASTIRQNNISEIARWQVSGNCSGKSDRDQQNYGFVWCWFRSIHHSEFYITTSKGTISHLCHLPCHRYPDWTLMLYCMFWFRMAIIICFYLFPVLFLYNLFLYLYDHETSRYFKQHYHLE